MGVPASCIAPLRIDLGLDGLTGNGTVLVEFCFVRSIVVGWFRFGQTCVVRFLFGLLLPLLAFDFLVGPTYHLCYRLAFWERGP